VTEGELEWQVVVTCDDRFFARVETDAALEFPPQWEERALTLDGDTVLIGRSSRGVGDTPQIDLSLTPADTAVSHRHAVLKRDGEGTWTVVDCRSTNGTYLNESAEPLEPELPVALHDGDQIHLGAWTTIELRRRPLSVKSH
jgi:pSer/pThr/pTyr-binding forkhead associated (FHA) protein